MADARWTNKGEPSYTKQIYDWLAAHPQIKEFSSFDVPNLKNDGRSAIASSVLDYLHKKGVLEISRTEIIKRKNGTRQRTKVYRRKPDWKEKPLRFHSKFPETTRNVKSGGKHPRSLLTLLRPEDFESPKQLDEAKENINNLILEAETLVQLAAELIQKFKKMVNENG